MYKKLYRSRTKRTIAGICGGLEDYFNLDATIIRLLWVVLVISTAVFPGLFAYFVAALIIPEEPVNNTFNNFNNGCDPMGNQDCGCKDEGEQK